MSQIAFTNSFNRTLLILQQIIEAHNMRPSFGYGPFSDFNASNNVQFPAIWVEAVESKVVNSIQGVKVAQVGLNIYALDRIDKGDSNFQEIHSDMLYLLETIIGYIRESPYTREQFITIDNQDQVFTPITRDTDENVNGFRVKLLLRLPDTYTPCDSPIGTPVGATISFPDFGGTQGPQGYQGPTGPQGEIGVTGSQGPQGFQGDQGFQGPQGFVGSTGSQGYQGLQGPIGPQGFQGDQGYQGPQGSPATPGSAAYGEMFIHNGTTPITLTASDTFYQITSTWSSGLLNGFSFGNTELRCVTPGVYHLTNQIIYTGDHTHNFSFQVYRYRGGSYSIISDLDATTSTAITGSPYISTSISGLVNLNQSDTLSLWVSCLGASSVTITPYHINLAVSAISGAQGPQGPTFSGSQGSQGPTGSQGFQGAQGFQGPQGFQGSGATGSQGPQGNTGSQGFQGHQGFQGPQGFQGIAGTPATPGSAAYGEMYINDGPSQTLTTQNTAYQITASWSAGDLNGFSFGSTGSLICNVGGTYHLTTQISIIGDNNHDLYFQIYKNGLDGNYDLDTTISTRTTGVPYISTSISGLIPLVVGDKITLWVTCISGGNVSITPKHINLALSAVAGAQGPTGPQGLQGTQGNQGFQGATGPQGFQGTQGNQGFQGATGPQGAQGTGYIFQSKLTTDSSITGTTSETILATMSIPANTLTTGNILDITARYRKSGATNTYNIIIKINTSSSLSGATTIASISSGSGANIVFAPWKRGIIKSASVTEFGSTVIVQDVGMGSGSPATGAVNNININWTVNQFLIFSTNLNTTAVDTVTFTSALVQAY